GQLALVRELFKAMERRDPAEVLPTSLPQALPYASQRAYVRRVLRDEVDLRARGTEVVAKKQENPVSQTYRERMNSDGSPSEIVATGYVFQPGTELARRPHRTSARGHRAEEGVRYDG